MLFTGSQQTGRWSCRAERRSRSEGTTGRRSKGGTGWQVRHETRDQAKRAKRPGQGSAESRLRQGRQEQEEGTAATVRPHRHH